MGVVKSLQRLSERFEIRIAPHDVRDAAATTYPQVVATLVDLLARVAECDKECAHVAGTAPSGEKRRLLGPELHAKKLTGFTRDTPSITRDLRLPDWNEPATTAWPQRTREVLTFAPGYARSPADWWRAGEARTR